MKLTVFCLFVAQRAGAQSTTEHLPVTDAEKIADTLRAGANFITDGATIVDYPASKDGEFRVFRKGTSDSRVQSRRNRIFHLMEKGI
jgi:hypothetical protein